MRRKLKRSLFFAGGVLFLPLGVVGLILPFVQGLLFIAVGLILLSISSPSIRSYIESHTRRFPRVHALFARLEQWIIRMVGPLEDIHTDSPKA